MNASIVSLIAAASAVLVASASFAETRTYTSADGKKLEAEVVAVRDGKASLKVAGGKTFTVPLDRLSESDQTFLKEWAKKNPSFGLNTLRFEVRKNRKSVRKDSEDKKKDKGKSEKEVSVSWSGYLQNNTKEAIDGIKVDYTIYQRYYQRGLLGTTDRIDEIEGVDEVGSLDGGAKYEFESDAAQEMTKIDKGDKNKKGSTKRQTVIGAVFKVSIGDKELITFEDPRGIVAKLEADRKREQAREKDRGN